MQELVPVLQELTRVVLGLTQGWKVDVKVSAMDDGQTAWYRCQLTMSQCSMTSRRLVALNLDLESVIGLQASVIEQRE